MAKINKVFKFSVDKVEEILDDELSDFATAKIHAFSDGWNRHNWYVSEEVLKKTADTIYDKPLVWVYDEKSDDIGSHDVHEVPCGFVYRENNPITYEEAEDGRLMLTINAKIWKRYSQNLLDIFQRDDMEKPVSVEMIVFDMQENEDGTGELKDFRYESITILGSNVTPAIPNANCVIKEFAVAKDNYLKEFAEKNKIEIDNSKESAVGENAKWSNPGRKLYNPIINASNKQALAKEAYLVIEGEDWEESPSTSLKYPHHVIKDGKLVVSISGVQAAFQRASQQGIVEGDVKAHLLRHYRELGLGEENFQEKEERDLPIDEKENKVEEFALTAAQIDNLLYNALEGKSLWARTHDDEYAYFYCYEDKACYRAKYTIIDGVAVVDLENKERVIEGAYQLASEIDLEGLESKKFEEGKTEEVEDAEDKEDDKEEEDFETKCAEYEQTIAKMQEDIDVYMAELTELREYKAQREDGDVKFAVAELFNEVRDVLPKEQLEAFEEEAKEVKFEALEAFKNKIKAKTLDFALPNMKSEVNRMAISTPIKEEKKKSFWSK